MRYHEVPNNAPCKSVAKDEHIRHTRPEIAAQIAETRNIGSIKTVPLGLTQSLSRAVTVTQCGVTALSVSRFDVLHRAICLLQAKITFDVCSRLQDRKCKIMAEMFKTLR